MLKHSLLPLHEQKLVHAILSRVLHSVVLVCDRTTTISYILVGISILNYIFSFSYHSQEHLINLSSCTGASKVPSKTVVGIRLFEQSCYQPYEVGYSDGRSVSRACLQIATCRSCDTFFKLFWLKFKEVIEDSSYLMNNNELCI